MDSEARRAAWEELVQRVDALLDGEDDWVAAMATVVCEVHHAFAHHDWTGFYRVVDRDLLVIGPYQGGHGCARIPFSRGVCGAAARTRATQLVPDVDRFPDHIACSTSTRSELVVPVVTPDGRLLAVLDLDSELPAAFEAVDAWGAERVCEVVGRRMGPHVATPWAVNPCPAALPPGSTGG